MTKTEGHIVWYEVVEKVYYPGMFEEPEEDTRTLLTTFDLGEAQIIISEWKRAAPLRDIRLEKAEDLGDGVVNYERIR